MQKERKEGFTLIELLVVVLIIGILAAVAVPQYQNAVRKAQGREVLVAIDALDKALADYYLEHGSYYGVDAETLNIEIPTLKHFKYRNTNSYNFQVGSGFDNGLSMEIKEDDGLQVGTQGPVVVYVKWENGHLQSATCSPGKTCRKYFEGEEIEIQTATAPNIYFYLKTSAPN